MLTPKPTAKVTMCVCPFSVAKLTEKCPFSVQTGPFSTKNYSSAIGGEFIFVLIPKLKSSTCGEKSHDITRLNSYPLAWIILLRVISG